MPDSGMPLQAVHHRLLRELVADKAEPTLGMEVLSVISDDAGRFLPAMLQRMQAQHGERRGVLVSEDAKYAALLPELVVVKESLIGH
jgi:hypothetical protein